MKNNYINQFQREADTRFCESCSQWVKDYIVGEPALAKASERKTRVRIKINKAQRVVGHLHKLRTAMLVRGGNKFNNEDWDNLNKAIELSEYLTISDLSTPCEKR